MYSHSIQLLLLTVLASWFPSGEAFYPGVHGAAAVRGEATKKTTGNVKGAVEPDVAAIRDEGRWSRGVEHLCFVVLCLFQLLHGSL